MASGTISLPKSATSGRFIEGKIDWVSTANTSSGTSSVTAKLYVKKGHTDMALTEATDGIWSYKLTVDGTEWTGTASKAVLEEWVLLTTRTVSSILHGTGGAKSITISGSVTAPTGTLFEGHTTKGSKTVALDTITRATTINSLTCSSDYVNGTITAYYTPQSNAYYNRYIVYVNVNNALEEIYRKNLDTKSAIQQQEPLDFTIENRFTKIYAAVPSSATVTIRVTFQTFTNSNYTSQVGSDQSREITLTLPVTVTPTINNFTVTPENTISWLKSKNIYVAGLSGAKASLTAAAGSGADLKSTTITYDGTSHEAVELNVSTLKKSGENIKFTAKALDTRGRSATKDTYINVLSYSAPAVTSMQAERGTYNNGWTAGDSGNDIKLVFKTTLSLSANGNRYNATFKIDGSAKTPSNSTTTGLETANEYTAYFLNVDGETSHTLTLTATDSVGKTGTAKLTIPTVHITMEFNDSGQGIAFGKTSEHNAFECAWDAEFHGTVKRIRADGTILSLDDTGWIDIGTSTSVTTTERTGFGHYIGCAYRVVNGNHVYVAFNVKATRSDKAVIVNSEAIPVDYRPKLQPYAIAALSSDRVARILVTPDGEVAIDWIRYVNDTVEPTSHTATWIDGYIDYFI